MLGWLRPAMGKLWRLPAKGLLKIGVTPNGVTVFGAVGAIAAAIYFIPQGGRNLFVGAMVIAAFAITDMLDGTMARLSGTSSRLGAWLDSTLDRFVDAAIFGAVAVAFYDEHPPTSLAALVALALGSFVPYARARAESLSIDAKGGLAERSDRLVIIGIAGSIVGLGGPLPVLTWTLVGLSVLALITVFQRGAIVARESKKDPSLPEATK